MCTFSKIIAQRDLLQVGKCKEINLRKDQFPIRELGIFIDTNQSEAQKFISSPQ